MTELTRHGRFWTLGNLRLCDVRELEEISYQNACLRKENERLADSLARLKKRRPDDDPVVRKNAELLGEVRRLKEKIILMEYPPAVE